MALFLAEQVDQRTDIHEDQKLDQFKRIYLSTLYHVESSGADTQLAPEDTEFLDRMWQHYKATGELTGGATQACQKLADSFAALAEDDEHDRLVNLHTALEAINAGNTNAQTIFGQSYRSDKTLVENLRALQGSEPLPADIENQLQTHHDLNQNDLTALQPAIARLFTQLQQSYLRRYRNEFHEIEGWEITRRAASFAKLEDLKRARTKTIDEQPNDKPPWIDRGCPQTNKCKPLPTHSWLFPEIYLIRHYILWQKN